MAFQMLRRASGSPVRPAISPSKLHLGDTAEIGTVAMPEWQNWVLLFWGASQA
jgi:hypothetical protein